MAAMRELERLDAVVASLQDLRVVVGQFGGLGAAGPAVAQICASNGARVDRRSTSSTRRGRPPPPTATRPRVYVGFEPRAESAATVAYYATAGFNSAGGQSLAARLAGELSATAIVGPVTMSGCA